MPAAQPKEELLPEAEPPLDTRRRLRVEVMGQSFTVVTDDAEEHVQRVASYVDARMRELGGNTPSFAVAVIAALNIASEYQKLCGEHAHVQEIIDRLVTRLEAGSASTGAAGGKEIGSSERATHPAEGLSIVADEGKSG